ncbi:MAG: SpoIID/LytB domain-containing protein [Candidatus Roizmanbacteria bacterium]
MRKLFFTLLLVFICVFFVRHSYADEYEDLQKEINTLRESLDSSQKATRTNEKTLSQLNAQLLSIKNKVVIFEKEIAKKEAEVRDGEVVMIKQKEILDVRASSYYKNMNKGNTSLLDVVMSANLSETLKSMFYQKTAMDEDRKSLIRTAMYIKDLEEKRNSLKIETIKLTAIKQEVAKQSDFLAGEVEKSKQWESQLQSKIASITARQQQILAQKLSSLNLPSSLGSGGLSCTDDRKLDPGFRPAFAFYTFGIPHRIGLNQYGADGRGRAGQSYEDILRAYFNDFSIENRNARIKVQGFGEMDLEEYMLGIYEMPNSFHPEALKAQAIAVRSYAMAYTNNGAKEICTTQSCQVYKGGNKGGAWEQAVKDTSGKVMVSGGQVIAAWFASTAGGYTFLSSDVGWSARSYTKRLRDTSGDINSLNDLFEKAYDKNSPCFYSAQGYRNEYNKSAWLKSDEVADIVNVLNLAKRDSGTQNHLSQADKSNPDGTDTWDKERVKQELKNRGGSPLNSVSDVSMSFDLGLGRTTAVTISGDGGTFTFDPSEFKNFFNLRAPANIQIVGGLFNIEKK